MGYCKNCDCQISKNFCSDCGQPAKVVRIDAHYILHEIKHVLHFEKGIFYTIKELLIRPGQNIREFITENRSKLVKPIIFIIISSLIYSIVNHFFNIEDGYIKFDNSEVGKNTPREATVNSIFSWIQAHYGYANIIIGVFVAFWLKVFFRKYKYNFYELLILLCFVMGVSMLVLSLFALLEGITKINLMQISGFIVLIYCSWAIGQFFDKEKAINYIKSLVSYILGMLTFSLSAIVLGLICDYFIHSI